MYFHLLLEKHRLVEASQSSIDTENLLFKRQIQVKKPKDLISSNRGSPSHQTEMQSTLANFMIAYMPVFYTCG